MARMLRWQGLSIFVVIVGIVIAIGYFFAETFVRKGIEQGAGWALGAEVNLEKVNLTYSPLNISLYNLQATDAEQPQQNLFVIEQATVSVDLWQYLLGKVIIDDLKVTGLAFHQPRTTAGEVYQSATDNQAAGQESVWQLPEVDLQLPSSETLLADSNLLTVKQANVVSASYEQETQKLKALQQQLPSKQKLAYYQEQLTELSKTKVKSLDDVAKIKTQYDEIKQQFKKDQQIVKQAKQQLIQTQALMAKQLLLLKSAPKKDWEAIEKKYQLEQINIEDFAHMLFGEQAREYYQTTRMLITRLNGVLAKNEPESLAQGTLAKTGRFVHFDEEEPLPSFLLKNANIAMTTELGAFNWTIQELTHQHWLRNKSTHMQLISKGLLSNAMFTALGQFTVNQTGQAMGDGQWRIADYPVEQVTIKDEANFSAKLSSGKLAGSGEFSVNAEQINSVNHFRLSQASYQGQAQGKLAKVLLNTLESMQDLAVNLAVTGAVSEPTFSISSPLDNQFKKLVQAQFTDKLDDFKAKVQSGLSAKLQEGLSLDKQLDSDVLALDTLFSDTENSLTQLLNSDIVQQKEDELKDKVKNKLKDKVKDKLGKFFG